MPAQFRLPPGTSIAICNCMRWPVVGVLALHGLIHAMGFAKAFGFAELPQLARPISRAMGAAWLLAGGLVIATAGMLAIGSRHTWLAAWRARPPRRSAPTPTWRRCPLR